MTARGISIEAYHRHIASGKLQAQWARIYYTLSFSAVSLTRSEIADMTGIRLSSVCGRVNELVKAGLVEELSRRKCSITHEQAHPVGAINRQYGLLDKLPPQQESER